MASFLTDPAEQWTKNKEGISFYQNRASGLVEEYKAPAKNLDDIAIGLVNSANAIKANIVSVGGNTGLGTGCYTQSTSYITSLYGSFISSVGIATASTLGVIGLGTSKIAYGLVKNDTLQAYTYPKIETLNASTENPFEGEGYVNLNSGNSGTGKDTIFVASGGSNAGYVFAIDVDVQCNRSSIENNVNSLISQYNNSLTGISSYNASATSIKSQKTEYQFHQWSYARQIVEGG